MTNWSQAEPLRFRDDSAFEYFIKEFFSLKFKDSFEPYGRKGQKQNGIDLKGKKKSNKTVIQCKNYSLTKLTTDIIDSDLKEAEFKFSDMKEYIFVTASKRDAKIQDHVHKVNSIFIVQIYFYDEIYEEAARYYPELLDSYFNVLIDSKVSEHSKDVDELKTLFHYTGVSCDVLYTYLGQLRQRYHDSCSAFFDYLDEEHEKYQNGLFEDKKLQKLIYTLMDTHYKIRSIFMVYYDFNKNEPKGGYLFPEPLEDNYKVNRELRSLIEIQQCNYSNFMTYVRDNYHEFNVHQKY
ncbi:hypothetical protein NRH57_001084 [Providencia rettgeri]|nr:hypothetical protein [Providencia rettgeri]